MWLIGLMCAKSSVQDDKKHTENIVDKPFLLSTQEVLRRFDTSLSGLNIREVEERAVRFGPNELPEAGGKSPWRMFIDQYLDPMIILLLVAALISGAIGEVHDTVVILIIVILNSLIGFFQEYRAEKAVQALKAMAAPFATVVREGKIISIKTRDVVPGDIIHLEAGQVVPADIRLVECAGLKLDESPLTGESVPVEKDVAPVEDERPAVADISNMVFKGTTVTYGRGLGVAVATGGATEIGRIARLIDEAEVLKTPLQKRLARVGRNLALAAIVICAVVFVAGILRGEGLLNMFLTSISLAVAAVPEALPAMVTISLALGARKMVRANALIRRLPAVETLGSVTYICTDKTGTLTLNRMQVEVLLDSSGMPVPFDKGMPAGGLDPDHKDLLLAMALNNDVHEGEEGALVGDPTEIALYQAAASAGVRKTRIEKEYPRIAEIPFSSDRQAMTTVHRDNSGRYIAFIKGGFEAVTDRCGNISKQDAEKWHLDLASRGLRVILFGIRRLEKLPPHIEDIEQDFEFLGMAGSLDPPRPEAAESVATCYRAGIRPVMITGDHPLTAASIARRIGILRDEADGDVLTGADLAEMDVDTLGDMVKKVSVYARVAPEQKLRLVAALQARGEAVAMTGDGVNDAPALKQADIGVAMGINGTDVAKQAADMILLDDNFATIVRSVEYGRNIYDNIRKFFRFLLASNTGEIWTIFLAPFFGLPIPLLPIHILWVNLITDGAPSLALTAEPPERNVMARPPRAPGESLFVHGMWQHIIWVGLLIGGLCLGVQAWAISTGHHWRTMVFTVLCLAQFAHVLAIRSEYDSLFSLGISSNRVLSWVLLVSVIVQLSVIYVPVLHDIFRVEYLDIPELVLCFVLASVVFWAVELEKFLIRKGILVYS